MSTRRAEETVASALRGVGELEAQLKVLKAEVETLRIKLAVAKHAAETIGYQRDDYRRQLRACEDRLRGPQTYDKAAERASKRRRR